MDNIAILSAGRQTYAKKRKLRQEQTQEIVFDTSARREYLTGFHKRKLERKEKAIIIAKEREKQERLETRKAAREARKEEIARKVKEINKFWGRDESESEAVDDIDGEQQESMPAGNVEEATFETPSQLTTVTMVEDFNTECEMDAKPNLKPTEGKAGDEGTVSSVNGKKKQSHSENVVHKKKKKFRYETKAARKATSDKIKRKKQNLKESLTPISKNKNKNKRRK